MAVASVKPYAN